MNRILEKKKILITRSREQSAGIIKELEGHGANVICLPTIKIVPLKDYSHFNEHLLNIKDYDYIIFTSANAVKMFYNVILNFSTQPDLSNIKIAAVGDKTAKTCDEFNIRVDIIPKEQSTDGLTKEFDRFDLQNKKILIPCSAIAREELTNAIELLGAEVFKIPVYNVIPTPKDDIENEINQLETSKPDLYIFTSPSTYNNYLKIIEISEPIRHFSNSLIAAIGTTTKEAINHTGVEVEIIPDKFNLESLLKKILNYYSHSK